MVALWLSCGPLLVRRREPSSNHSTLHRNPTPSLFSLAPSSPLYTQAIGNERQRQSGRLLVVDKNSAETIKLTSRSQPFFFLSLSLSFSLSLPSSSSLHPPLLPLPPLPPPPLLCPLSSPLAFCLTSPILAGSSRSPSQVGRETASLRVEGDRPSQSGGRLPVSLQIPH